MTAILTRTRAAVWTCLKNWPALKSGSNSIFTTLFEADADVERLELQGLFLPDLPAVAVRWAAFEPGWHLYQTQRWPAAIVVETWWSLAALSTAESRVQDVIEAVGRYAATPGVNYLQSQIGHYPERWGPVSVEAVEIRERQKAYRAQVSFILPNDHNPIKG
jgi:hypothetical protein